MIPREEESVWAGPTWLYIYKLYFCYVYIFDTPIRTGALLTFVAIFSPQFCTFAISAFFFSLCFLVKV